MKITKPFTQWTGKDFVYFVKSLDKATLVKIGAGAVFLLLFCYFFAWPAWFKNAEVKQKVAAIEGQLVRLQTLKRNEKNWLLQKKESLEYIKTVKERLYFPGETSLLLGLISKMAEQSGVTIIASRPRNEETVEFPEPYKSRYRAELYDFAVEGGYHQIGDFISQIESYQKMLRVEVFQMDPQDETANQHLVDLTLSAVLLQGEEAKGKR